MEYIHCNLCGSTRSSLVFSCKDQYYDISNDDYHVVKCRDCGLVYVNPRPTEEEILSYYTNDYYSVHINKNDLLREKEASLQSKFDKVKHVKPGRLLDIGCQKGEFLYFMQQKGWEVKGVDFSPSLPNLFGLDIFYGSVEKAGFAPEYFDLITLWAVLEHVYHPREMLNEVYRLLKPGGTVLLLVTNFNSIPGRFMRHDDVPRHTTMFSKKTISKILRCIGFNVNKYYFGHDIFSGSTRGFLNYVTKLLAGEKINDILSQNRSADWTEFSSRLCGKDSQFMRRIDKLDNAISPTVDRMMDRLGWGFIMTVVASKLH
jgi:2-polyprenyl-3-methyl-5-hydroxy-6-metoxy-1,4-benzoquinol methylase